MRNISTKELNYINDFLSFELLSAKKCHQYAWQETNQAHQQVLFNAARVHQQNYNNLLDYVNKVNMEQGGQMH